MLEASKEEQAAAVAASTKSAIMSAAMKVKDPIDEPGDLTKTSEGPAGPAFDAPAKKRLD